MYQTPCAGSHGFRWELMDQNMTQSKYIRAHIGRYVGKLCLNFASFGEFKMVVMRLGDSLKLSESHKAVGRREARYTRFDDACRKFVLHFIKWQILRFWNAGSSLNPTSRDQEFGDSMAGRSPGIRYRTCCKRECGLVLVEAITAQVGLLEWSLGVERCPYTSYMTPGCCV